jgi:hypothetical protein
LSARKLRRCLIRNIGFKSALEKSIRANRRRVNARAIGD